MKNEATVYQYLNGCYGIPALKWFGKDDVNYYMIITLLGKSLQCVINESKTFSLSIVLEIGIELIKILKTIHDKGLVHRDIKPDNFLFDINKSKHIYLIDFGFCKPYALHMPSKQLNNMIGSKNYASIMSHKHYELSRRDDLESLCYMLLYFYSGFLSWNCVDDENEIIRLKTEIENNASYPPILLHLLQYARLLAYEETPNYYLIINNFMKEIEIVGKKG